MRRLVVLAAALAALAGATNASAAGWCLGGAATADRPDAVTGPQLHLVYAIPADGADGYAAYAPEMAADAASVDAWWQTQDPTRAPRFDLAAGPGCSGFDALDVTFLRLPTPSAQLAALAGDIRAATLLQLVPSFGRWKKTVVYYDGPISDPDLCGAGLGSQTSGIGSLSVIYVRSLCAATPGRRAAVLAHELTHELGWPDSREPHPCGADGSHVCDSPLDLMYPALNGHSLDDLVLDVNRDDYYRGGVTVDLSTSTWLRHLDAPPQQLALTVTGGGQVTSDVPGLACSAACATTWDDGTRLTLTAVQAQGQRFVGWRGGCTGLDCTPTVTAATAIEAVFAPVLTLRATVAGKGRVVAHGLDCPGTCRARVQPYPVQLTATPARGWRFAGWTGACRGKSAVCRLPAPKADVAVRARFTKL